MHCQAVFRGPRVLHTVPELILLVDSRQEKTNAYLLHSCAGETFAKVIIAPLCRSRGACPVPRYGAGVWTYKLEKDSFTPVPTHLDSRLRENDRPARK